MSQPTTYIRFELKYCEGCGGLWLRPLGTAAAFCSACTRRLFPTRVRTA